MNTRFNPTTNGSLHIGHIYMALMNEAMAHDSGGKFHVRFDDNTTWLTRHYVRQIPGKSYAIPEHADIQLEELTWMGIQIDSTSSQTGREEEVNKFLATTHFRMVIDSVGYGFDPKPVIVTQADIPPFPLCVRHTVEKVVSDHWEGTDALIRGLEWLVEHNLYQYFCALFGFRFPLCYYIPRLITACSGLPVSKTMGNWSVPELRKAGASSEQVRWELRASCLVNPGDGWNIENLKSQPRLVSRSVEDVLGR